MAEARATAPRKFLFETSFEQANRNAGGKTVSQAELAKIREQAFAEGKQAGAGQAMQALEQRIAHLLEALSKQLDGLAAAQSAAVVSQTREATAAALAVLRKLFPRLARTHGLSEIEAMVAECLQRLHKEPRLVVRVADPLLDEIEKRIKPIAARCGFEGRIVLLSQDGLAPGDVRVEWADGGAERDSQRLWQEIEDIVRRTAGEPPRESTAAPAASPARRPAAGGTTQA